MMIDLMMTEKRQQVVFMSFSGVVTLGQDNVVRVYVPKKLARELIKKELDVKGGGMTQ